MSRVMEAMILEDETEQDMMDSSTDLTEDEADLSDNENAEEDETEQPEPQEEEHQEAQEKVPEIDYDRFLPILDFSKVTDEEICHVACNKLLQDSYFGINGFPVIACFLWAYNKAKDDLAFAKQVCVKSKNFSKAFDYLKKVIMSGQSGASGGVGMDHRQIFAILEEYFALDDAEVARKEAEAEKVRKEKTAKAKAAKNPAKEKSKAKEKTTKTAKHKKEEKADTPQISFEDLLGGVC